MSEIRESGFDHVAGDHHASFFTSEKKWIGQIKSLMEEYPNDIELIAENQDGSILVHLPAAWLKIRPKKKINLTAEQIAASKARLEQGRLKRLEKIGDDDAHVEDMGKEEEEYEQGS